MATSLGAFSVDVMANIAKFESDLGRAHRIAERQADKMKKALAGVAGVLGVGFSAKAFAGWIQGAIDTQDEASKMAQKIGIATQSVAGLTLASKQSGIEQQQFQSAMVRLARNASDASQGLKTQAMAFSSIGVAVTDTSGKLRGTEAILGDVANKMAGYTDSAQKTAIATQLFGKAGADLIPMLNGGKESLAEYIKMADDFGLTIGGKAAKEAERFNDTMEQLSFVSKGVANQIATALAPALADLADKAVRFFRSNEWKAWLDTVSKGAKAVADNIGSIIAALKLLGGIAVTAFVTNYAAAIASATVKLGILIVSQKQYNALAAEMGITAAASSRKSEEGFLASLKSIGLVNAAFGALMSASVGWQIGTYLRDEFLEVRLAGIEFVDDILAGWERMKAGSAIAWEAIKYGALGALDGIAEAMASTLRGFASASDISIFGKNIFGGSTENLNALAQKLSDATTPAQGFAAAVASIKAEADKNIAAIHENTSGLKEYETAAEAAGGSVNRAADSAGAFAGALGESAPGLRDMAGAAAEAAKKAAELAAAQDTFRESTLRMASEMLGPIAKAQAEYRDGIVEAWKAFQKGEATIEDFTDRQKVLAAQLNKTSAEFAKQADVVGQYTEDLQGRFEKLGMDERALAISEAVEKWAESYEKLDEEGKKAAGSIEDFLAKVKSGEGAFYDQAKALDKYQDQLRKTQDMWGDFADAVFDAVTQSGSFLKNLLNNLKSIVTQMLKEWFRTKVIGMFTGGGGGGWGAVAGAAAMSMSGGASGSSGGGATQTATNMAMNYATGGGSGLSLFDPGSWTTAGQSLYDGFSASATSGSNMFGTYTADAGTGTWAPSTTGYVAAGAAGVYAGYQRWEGSNKDLGGAAGAAAYGVGTYGAAVGVSAAMTGGMAAGLAAIPVVGWIALALMAVDMLSGGKLFGTKGKMHHSNLTMDVGAAGADIAQSYTLKGEKAFFGGTKWTTKQADVSPEARAAATQFYDALLKNREEFAKAFGKETGSLVGGIWEAEFDKKGELTKSSATVMGAEYKDATQEQFGQILVAENMIDVLSEFDDKLSSMAESYRGNIEGLEQFANAAAIAQTALMAGAEMLALGADDSLSAFLSLAEGMRSGSETIDQTLQRLLQAQAQYDQFVVQFDPGITYVDQFQAQLSGLNAQMLANIDQANALARAAGAEGAATQDLVNIHAYAAKQFEQLLRQLKQQAQSLAFSMGLTNIGTLDQIDTEIARLQGMADQGAQSVGGFGDAMGRVAQQANEAVNLLLGNLSPLNDMEKLEVARAGLIAGTVAQEDFLEIARRLHASSIQYEREFAFSQQFAGRGRTGGGGGSGAGGVSGGAGGLSSADRERLEMLLDQRADAYAQQDFINAQTLAQQIAEISSASGEDIEDVLSSMGIDDAERMQEFAERLHLDNADQLLAYIENWQKQMDSNGENTASIVDAINRLGDRLLGVQTREENARDGNGPVMPGGHIGRGNGDSRARITDDDANRIGEAVARHSARNIPHAPRNIRPVYERP